MIPDMPQEIEMTFKSLKANNFDAHYAQTAAGAKRLMLDMIPLTGSMGVGDSATLRQTGILEELIRLDR